MLARNAGKPLKRSEIAGLLKESEGRSDRSIDVAISRIRSRFSEEKEIQSIVKTVWGRGYIFAAVKDAS